MVDEKAMVNEKQEEVSLKTGLTLLEQECMDGLMGSYRAFLKMERQHPDEMRDFIDAVHKSQDILAVRVVRRLYPEGWPTHTINKTT